MATNNPSNSNLPVFHTYVREHDADRPWAHFGAEYIGSAIMLRDVSGRYERTMTHTDGSTETVLANDAEGIAVRLLGIRYDADADQVVVDVAPIDGGAPITLDPAQYDVFIPRNGDGAVAEYTRVRGKLRAKWYKHYGSESVSAWTAFVAETIDVDSDKRSKPDSAEKAANTARLTAAVADYVAAHPLAPKAGAKRTAERTLNTDISKLAALPIRPATAPSADAIAAAKAKATATAAAK